jgi:hypothetical protein
MLRAVRMGLPYAKSSAQNVRIIKCHSVSGEGTLSLRSSITILCDNIETHFTYTSVTLIIQNKLPLYVEFVPIS